MLTIIDLFMMFYNVRLIGKFGVTSLRECNVFLSFLFLPGAIVLDIIIISYLLGYPIQ